MEVGRAHGLSLPSTRRLGELVQIGEEEPYTFENFLSKFQTLRLFYRSPEIITRITREAIADAAADNVRYLELRFTPFALARAQGFPLSEVVDWVVDEAQKSSREFSIQIRLIVSMNRHEDPNLGHQLVQLAADRRDRGIVGLDLAGDEAGFSGSAFASVFESARQAGLHITVHAGEWGSARNVTQAITELGAERIGHGVRVLEDPSAASIAKERGVIFEVCITSNYQSGVVTDLAMHPLPRMMYLGLKSTINTDDPSISRITLSDEYQRAYEQLGINSAKLREAILTAARSAFLPKDERQALVDTITKELSEKI